MHACQEERRGGEKRREERREEVSRIGYLQAQLGKVPGGGSLINKGGHFENSTYLRVDQGPTKKKKKIKTKTNTKNNK